MKRMKRPFYASVRNGTLSILESANKVGSIKRVIAMSYTRTLLSQVRS